MDNSSVDGFIVTSTEAGIGRMTLNRPKALNALSLAMIQSISKTLTQWRDDASVTHVLLRGTIFDKVLGESQPFGAFCAGGDIRYFHEAVHAAPSDALNRDSLEVFFTEEYQLNHLIHHYPKPVIAFMDGVVMGGGMGISQGASTRIVTERTKMAMPETAIGLFPDVGGGYFLSRCANSAVGVGEYLALTGQVLSGQEAVSIGLADVCVPSSELKMLWEDPKKDLKIAAEFGLPFGLSVSMSAPHAMLNVDLMQQHFALRHLDAIVQSLQTDTSDWAQAALSKLQKNSPFMLAVTLEQIRRARTMSLADDLRMERDMVFHSFAGTPARHSDTVEGIRALVIDKDHSPKWQPARIADVRFEAVNAFFVSPWAADQHPLRNLSR